MKPAPAEIKQTRIDAGLTVVATAKIMRVTRKTVHAWESGMHPMKSRDFEYLQIKIAELLS